MKRTTRFQKMVIEDNANGTINIELADGRKFFGCYPIDCSMGGVELGTGGTAVVSVQVKFNKLETKRDKLRTRNLRASRSSRPPRKRT